MALLSAEKPCKYYDLWRGRPGRGAGVVKFYCERAGVIVNVIVITSAKVIENRSQLAG